MPTNPSEEFPRSDPAVTPDSPEQSAPARKGMLVVYHGDGDGKEAATLGVLFRAHGRGLPVRHMKFATPSEPPSGDDLALERLGISSHHMAQEGPEGAKGLWQKAVRHISIVQEGVLVLDGLADAVREGWLSTEEATTVLEQNDSLLHIIVTGRTAPSELIEIADLVSNMRAIKQRDASSPAIVGIDY
ncbi:MAG: hypothetical protein HOC77_08385 [Chloroflexi bacterium]|jgi:cob(I)alamin adenosyltransferase|nr:hypothetical protein [Chloroflexota bacterium]MBT4073192.1 hypothetical protein [Chloroflexota bacterium]MBT4515088.1 hypothetical protein [Chloroflexota bacterium]MBT6681405.1 hypothetical protein [Chloroflexota bacterium]